MSFIPPPLEELTPGTLIRWLDDEYVDPTDSPHFDLIIEVIRRRTTTCVRALCSQSGEVGSLDYPDEWLCTDCVVICKGIRGS